MNKTFYRCYPFITGGYSLDIDGSIHSHGHSKNYQICYSEYFLIKETKSGYWISSQTEREDLKIKEYCHFVLKNSVKKFAYLTKEEALHGFKCRLNRRIEILQKQLSDCQSIISLTS